MSRQFVDDLLHEVETRLGAGLDATAGAAARRQELRAAIGLLRDSIAGDSATKFNAACERLEHLARSRSAKDERWTATKLDALRGELEVSQAKHPSSEVNRGETESCDVLILAALYEPELKAFVEHHSDAEDVIGNHAAFVMGRTYYRGTLARSSSGAERGPIKVVALFQDRMGMAECAAVVSSAVSTWRPRLVAMTGVCAGRDEAGVKLNDIIVPSEIFTYDTGKRTVAGFLREPLWCEVSSVVIQRVRVRANEILKTMAADIRRAFPGPIAMPRVHTDVMACGSRVLDFPGAINSIAGVNRKVVAIDMESYALVRASLLSDRSVKAMVVKGVMDLATGKTDEVKAQAAAWAAAFLARFIQSEYDAITGTGG